MPALNRSRKLYRHLLLLYAAGTLVTATVIALAIAIPAYQRDKSHQEHKLLHTAQNRALLVEAYLDRLGYIARQISSRTAARHHLEAYLRGEIDRARLSELTRPIFEDASGGSPEILGVTRLGPGGERLVTTGIEPPPIPPQEPLIDTGRGYRISSPLQLDSRQAVVVTTPIGDHKGGTLGTDIVLFDIEPLFELLNRRTGLGKEYEVALVAFADGRTPTLLGHHHSGQALPPGLAYRLTPQAGNGNGVTALEGPDDETLLTAHVRIDGLPWVLLMSAPSHTLYEPVRREALTLLLTGALLLVVGLFVTGRLLRPLTRQVLLHTDELEQRLDQHTIQLRRSNRALQATQACGKAIIHTGDEQRLLERICSIMVQTGGYRFAWIGYARDDSYKSIEPMASAGIEEGYLNRARLSWDAANPRGLGPGGRAIRSRTTVIVRDTENDPLFTPWREEARRRGFASVIALPLLERERAFGVLLIYAAEPDAFDSEEVGLLENLAEDIAFGIGVIRSDRQRREAEQRLIESEARWRSLTQHSPDHILTVNADLKIEFANRAPPGLTEETLIGRSILDFIEGAEKRHEVTAKLTESLAMGRPCTFESSYTLPEGSTAYFESHVVPRLVDGHIAGLTISSRDITDRRTAQARIQYLAYHDELTTLPNRRLLMDILGHTLSICRRHGTKGALMFLDLDHFKTINDSVGHAVGDAILKQVAQRLNGSVRAEDVVARLGGDEFLVLLPELSADTDEAIYECSTVGEKLRQVLARPFDVEGHEYHITPSIGIALFPLGEESIDDILKHADAAMYKAKTAGRNAVQFYHPSMQAAADDRLALEKGLRHALDQQELELFYQPLIDASGCIAGAEALLRWRSGSGEFVPPDRFIPVAEETGLILDIGHWVLRRAVEELSRWCRHDWPRQPGFLAVNVSPRQFHHPDFVASVEAVLSEFGVDPTLLKLEITENIVIANVADTVAKMEALRALGIRIAIDDFGTGYSSLAYLKRLPIDQIKIDKSFVLDITDDGNDAAIVETIIAVAHHLDLDVVAEGVEDRATLAMLRRRACHYFQGHYFSPAIEASQFERVMSERHCFEMA